MTASLRESTLYEWDTGRDLRQVRVLEVIAIASVTYFLGVVGVARLLWAFGWGERLPRHLRVWTGSWSEPFPAFGASFMIIASIGAVVVGVIGIPFPLVIVPVIASVGTALTIAWIIVLVRRSGGQRR